jgi:hypothetical protein
VNQLQNTSLTNETTWEQDGLTYRELIRQEYQNDCVFSAGEVDGDLVDCVYLCWQKPDDPGVILRLRPDELAALAWCATGILWSHLLGQVPEENKP